MIHKLYPSQLPTEKIMLVVRESLFLLFVKIVLIIILMFIPFIISLTSAFIGVELGSPQLTNLLNLAEQLYYLSLVIILFIIFILYYLNLNVVSDQRIVDIDQRGLLYREVSELNIETIEDVTTETNGLFGHLFNYGTVFIQTAGARERFEFNNVTNPGKISSLILELYEKHEGKELPKT